MAPYFRLPVFAWLMPFLGSELSRLPPQQEVPAFEPHTLGAV